jgi:unsaturated rhamnogalacturonyl hydrolase
MISSPDQNALMRPSSPLDLRLPSLRAARTSRTSPLVLTVLLLLPACIAAQSIPLSQQLADAAIKPHATASATRSTSAGDEELLDAISEEWSSTADASYFRYVKAAVESRTREDGTIVGSAPATLTDFAIGRQLVMLYQVTREERYFKAASSLKNQLSSWPRDDGGVLLHDRSGKSRMRVEDLNAIGPFCAAYAAASQNPEDFRDIAAQFVQFTQHARNPVTGLLSSQQGGSTGAANLHDTAVYSMALLGTLQNFPRGNAGRATLLSLLSKAAMATEGAISAHPDLVKANAATKNLDATSNLSTIALLTYIYAKGYRLEYLPEIYSVLALKLYRIVASYGLDGDIAIAGELILANREMEIASTARKGHDKSVVLDAWFNSQKRSGPTGKQESFHYKWNDESDSGFSTLGHLFSDYGLETRTLYDAPTLKNLSSAQVYMIVSPDNPAKNPQPHYVTEQDAVQVAEWVRLGGVLVLMENDPGNADIEHTNLLADKFGIHFENTFSHHVIGDTYSMGRIEAPADDALFTSAHTLYMKDTCTITVTGSARPLLTDKGDVMMATAKFGRGTVFAVVDPWLYNEYVDGRKLPADFDNRGAARELLNWLLRQIPAGAKTDAR